MLLPTRLARLVAIIWCLSGGALCFAQSRLSLPDYLAELNRLGAAVKAANGNPTQIVTIRDQLPISWEIEGSPQRTFSVRTDYLRQEFSSWGKAPSSDGQNTILAALQSLRSEASSMQQHGADYVVARTQLHQILAAAEFNAVHGPTLLDRLKQKLMHWLGELFMRIFASSSIPTLANVVVYGLLVIAVIVAAWWVYRTIENNAPLEVLLSNAPLPKKEWSQWLIEATDAAKLGNWRDAIHMTYWCGICFLEARGLWRPDRARTPREYLRLLPSASEYHPALLALTRSFEFTWYGRQDANADSFAAAVAQLEKLGCRLS
jgi:hypothetical protein